MPKYMPIKICETPFSISRVLTNHGQFGAIRLSGTAAKFRVAINFSLVPSLLVPGNACRVVHLTPILSLTLQ